MESPDARDQRIAELEAEVRDLKSQLREALGVIGELKAKLNQNSTNSNKPPSSDGPAVDRPKGRSKGKKRGGQTGHDPHRRELIPVEECRKVFSHVPSRCGCGSRRLGKPELRSRHQVVYLPKLVAPIDEHRSFACVCKDCGQENVAPIPPEILASAFGACVTALIAQLVGQYRLSRRNVQRILEDLFGIEISLGAVSDQEDVASRAVEKPVAEVREAIQTAGRANLDETGWKMAKQRAWLWVAAVTGLCCAFVIARSRGGAVARALLGKAFKGILGSDRWRSYDAAGAKLRQICWAHLIRDFVGWTELGGEGARLGKALLRKTEKMFRWWSQVKDGELSRAAFQAQMEPVRRQILLLLMKAEKCASDKVRGMAREILDLEDALFTFVEHAGIEPTNNLAERMLRHAVIWRRLCFGCDSERGARFAERILTVTATLKMHGRDVREYLTAAVTAYREGRAAPSLLPAQA